VLTLLLRTRAWLAATLSVVLAALQPNLALVLIAVPRLRVWVVTFALGAACFAGLMLAQGGIGGISAYLQLLRNHGSAERFDVIQISPGAIAYGFGADETTAGFVRLAVALVALAGSALAIRRLSGTPERVGLAICALPFVLPFFHEHDFLLALVPAMLCATQARGATLAFAAIAAVASGVDWLGLGQRPDGALQSIVLATTTALGFALVARLQPQSLFGLCVVPAVALTSLVARAHPVPIWPDALPAHWQPPPGLDVTHVWELEQTVAGLTTQEPVWAALRALALLAAGALGVATYRLDVDVHEVVERRLPVGVEAG